MCISGRKNSWRKLKFSDKRCYDNPDLGLAGAATNRLAGQRWDPVQGLFPAEKVDGCCCSGRSTIGTSALAQRRRDR